MSIQGLKLTTWAASISARTITRTPGHRMGASKPINNVDSDGDQVIETFIQDKSELHNRIAG